MYVTGIWNETKPVNEPSLPVGPVKLLGKEELDKIDPNELTNRTGGTSKPWPGYYPVNDIDLVEMNNDPVDWDDKRSVLTLLDPMMLNDVVRMKNREIIQEVTYRLSFD